MKRLMMILVGLVLIPALSGCANGPIRTWLRGGECDTCNPPTAHPTFPNPCAGGTCAPAGPMNAGAPGNQIDPYAIVPPANQLNPGPATGSGSR